jgi:hypothetical protein
MVKQKKKEVNNKSFHQCSYEMFLVNGEKYLKFSGDLAYPLLMVSSIVQGCRKENLKGGNKIVGVILQFPNPFPKKTKEKFSKPTKTTARGNSVKKSTKNVRTKSTRPKSRRK